MSTPSRIIDVAASDLPGGGKPDGCRRCGCPDGYLARYIQVNGHVAIRWVCDWCEDYGTKGDLPRSILGAVPLEELPVRVDRRGEYTPPAQREECAVCGEPAEEFHHWAPLAIFPDWPLPVVSTTLPGNELVRMALDGLPLFRRDLTVPMCRPHHREWHARMRAHGLKWPHELGEVA